MRRVLRSIVVSCLALASLVLLAPSVRAQDSGWNEETLNLFARLPVQEGGRVKPVSTVAMFRLQAFSARRTIKVAGRRLGATEWLLDCLFRPGRASGYPTFRVASFEVIDALELLHDGKRMRDLYSYNELRPAIGRLYDLANQYSRIEMKKRSAIQQQIYMLGHNISDYESLVHVMDPFRRVYDVGGSERLRKIYGEPAKADLMRVLSKYDQVRAIVFADPPPKASTTTPAQQLVGSVLGAAQRAQALQLFPPADKESEEWLTLGDVLAAKLRAVSSPNASLAVAQLPLLASLVDHSTDPDAFEADLRRLHDNLVGMARTRNEYDKVELEVTYYGLDLLFYSQWLYVLAFVLVAFLWLKPSSKRLFEVAWWALLPPTVLLVAAIAMRCMIRGRPPVSTLYETTLFITAVAVAVLMFVERVNKRRVALSVAAILGAAGLFLANSYEMRQDGGDTMPTLLAVLRTNFWLSTHVTMVAIGYSASLLAAALGHAWLILRLVRPRSRELLSSIARMIYGAVCFGLFFSVVGTILGGVWANDSWGRFWGWDPKENGALLICLSQILILHARLGGLIRHMGLALLAIALGMVTTFSWWHVNLLGVGLHSYGFTEGAHRAVWTVYFIDGGLIALGMGVAMMSRRKSTAVAQARGGEAALHPHDIEDR